MSRSRRVVRWARSACAVIDAVKSVVVALRGLLLTVTFLVTMLAAWVTEVVAPMFT
jgi:hypothetical protein